MNNKELLYKKLNALRLEVHGSIVDDIKSTVDAIFQEQNLQQCIVSGALPPDELLLSAIKYGYDYHKTTSFPNESFEDNMKGNALQWIENRRQ